MNNFEKAIDFVITTILGEKKVSLLDLKKESVKVKKKKWVKPKNLLFAVKLSSWYIEIKEKLRLFNE